MVGLAQLLKGLSHELYHPSRNVTLAERSAKSLNLDQRLMEWKAKLPPNLDMEKTSLVEPEWVTKQKIVLELRRCLPP